MSGEITVTSSLQCSNGNFKIPKLGGVSQQIDQDVAGGGLPGFVKVATAGEDLTLTDLTLPGLCYVKNVEPSGGNFMTIGPKVAGTYHPFIRLDPGEEYVFRLSALAGTVHVKADTAEVDAIISILDS